MKGYSILVLLMLLLLLQTPVMIHASTDTTIPEWRHQGQSMSIVRQAGHLTLYAQGKDNIALNQAILLTNETSEWVEYISDIPAWNYRKQILIDHTKVVDDLVNFPVLIMHTSSHFITAVQPDGSDFLFYDYTHSKKLNHEIEYYNSNTGELVAWVNIPYLSSSMNTIVYLYYGNPDCEDQQNKQGTWDDDFLLVNHMTGDSWNELKDSTANNNDITGAWGNPQYNQPGIIGKSVGFSGASSYLKANTFRLLPDSSYTGCAWVYVDGNPGQRRYIFEGDSDWVISLMAFTHNKFRASTNTDGGTSYIDSTTEVDVSSPQWCYVCTRVDTSTSKLAIFVNGIKESHTTLKGTMKPETQGLNIGTYRSHNTYWMHGLIDEIRISNVVRSDSWIQTEYNNMADPLSFAQVTAWSPLNMQKNSQWQWSNFTWCNPSIPVGTQVGWRIRYVDTNGNSCYTNIMSFTVVEEHYPPQTPAQPKGVTTGYVHESYIFTVDPVIDPDGHQISYLFDWGDGTQSGWTEFVPSGTGYSLSHTWETAGMFAITVKAKDESGEQSNWSEPLYITIQPSPTPALILSFPESVLEGTMFTVTVTSNGYPVEMVQINLKGNTYLTNEKGMVSITAPIVNTTTMLPIIAYKEGYQTASTMITILDHQGLAHKAWIYGRVSDIFGDPLQDATICLVTDDVLYHCVFSSHDGKYHLLVPTGVLRVEVRKNGYTTIIRENITAEENVAINLNFELQPIEGSDSILRGDLIDYAIKYGIKEGIVGGSIQFPLQQPAFTTIYDTRITLQFPPPLHKGEIQFSVSGPSGTPGTVIAIQIFESSDVFAAKVNFLEELIVEIDGIVVPMATNIGDIFNPPGTATEPLWAGLLTEKLYILVLIPSFSTHEITITTIDQLLPGIRGIAVFILYISISIMVAVLFISPLFVRMIRRRRFFKK